MKKSTKIQLNYFNAICAVTLFFNHGFINNLKIPPHCLLTFSLLFQHLFLIVPPSVSICHVSPVCLFALSVYPLLHTPLMAGFLNCLCQSCLSLFCFSSSFTKISSHKTPGSPSSPVLLFSSLLPLSS